MRDLRADLCIACVVLWSIGCSSVPAPHAPVPVEAQQTFRIVQIRQPRAVQVPDRALRIAPGFDLDGENGGTLGCTRGDDFASPRGERGIDNRYTDAVALLAYAYTDLGWGSPVEHAIDAMDAAVDAQIASGDWSLVLVLDGMDDGWTDDEVSVRVVRATEDGDRLRVTAELESTTGRIEQGRLLVALTALELPFGERLGARVVERVQIGAQLSQGELTDGEIGGALSMATVDAVVASLVEGVDRTTTEALAQPDLDPDADGMHCGSLSLGVTFEAEPVILDE
jgi:hypothetical protein